MPAKLRPRHATVVAYLALFVALGGTSYAAIQITGKQVKDRSLTGKDVRKNSLTGRHVKNLKSGDVANGSLRALDFAPGQLPRGEKGEKGDRGPVGPTAAAAGGDYLDPQPDPTAILDEVEITLPAAGRIYAQASIRSAQASCSFSSSAPGAAGNCLARFGIYVDGQPVPKSARELFASSASGGSSFTTNLNGGDFDWSLFGVSGPLAAGKHKIQLGVRITATPTNGITTGGPGPNGPNANAIVGGIAIGG